VPPTNWQNQNWYLAKMNGTDAGKSMKNALYILLYAKRHLSGWSVVKQQKMRPIALAIIELCLSEGINQL